MEHTTLTEKDLHIKMPFRLLIVGPTSSGKTTLVYRLLKQPKALFGTTFQHIVYAVPKMTDSHAQFVDMLQNSFPHLTVHEGIPDIEQLGVMTGSKLLILDDLIHAVVNSESMHKAFTVLSSHTNTNIILISQNYFTQGKFANSLIRNISDKILFNDKSDRMWLNTVSRRMFPGSSGFLNNAMEWVTENFPQSWQHYLYIDSNPRSRLGVKHQVRTNIIQSDDLEQGPSDEKNGQSNSVVIDGPVFLAPTK